MQTKQGRDTSTLAFRISIPKRRLIEAAAAQRGLLVSHWLREVALKAARGEMQK